jgi:hypothetical protein
MNAPILITALLFGSATREINDWGLFTYTKRRANDIFQTRSRRAWCFEQLGILAI